MAQNRRQEHRTRHRRRTHQLVESPRRQRGLRSDRTASHACGFKTVHALPADRWYLSHFPAFGTVIRSQGGTPLALEARFEAPGDPGEDVVLRSGLRDAASSADAAGIPRWTESPSSAQLWKAATVPAAPALTAFTAARLSSPNNEPELARVRTALNEVPAELLITLVLDSTMSTGLIAGNPEATQQLIALTQLLLRRELASALPLVRGTQVLLVVGAIPLPGAGAPLSSRRIGFRWYVLPINGLPGTLELPVGPRNRYTRPTASGLSAVVAVSLARTGEEDPRGAIRPYEVRVELPRIRSSICPPTSA